MLFLIANKAKDMPTHGAGKLLNLGAPGYLVAGNAALMRALPCFGAHCPRTSEPVKIFSDPSGLVCAGSHA